MQKISMKGLSAHYDADSCGTSRYNIGDSPDPRTLRNATSHGIRMSHRARQLLKSDLEHFDHVLVMDAENMRSALSFSEVHNRSKIQLIRMYDPQGPGDVPDPYYGDERDFQNVFEILDRSIGGLIASLEIKSH